MSTRANRSNLRCKERDGRSFAERRDLYATTTPNGCNFEHAVLGVGASGWPQAAHGWGCQIGLFKGNPPPLQPPLFFWTPEHTDITLPITEWWGVSPLFLPCVRRTHQCVDTTTRWNTNLP